MEVLGCPAAEYYGGRKGMILEPPGGVVCMGIFGYRRLWSLPSPRIIEWLPRIDVWEFSRKGNTTIAQMTVKTSRTGTVLNISKVGRCGRKCLAWNYVGCPIEPPM